MFCVILAFFISFIIFFLLQYNARYFDGCRVSLFRVFSSNNFFSVYLYVYSYSSCYLRDVSTSVLLGWQLATRRPPQFTRTLMTQPFVICNVPFFPRFLYFLIFFFAEPLELHEKMCEDLLSFFFISLLR